MLQKNNKTLVRHKIISRSHNITGMVAYDAKDGKRSIFHAQKGSHTVFASYIMADQFEMVALSSFHLHVICPICHFFLIFGFTVACPMMSCSSAAGSASTSLSTSPPALQSGSNSGSPGLPFHMLTVDSLIFCLSYSEAELLLSVPPADMFISRRRGI